MRARLRALCLFQIRSQSPFPDHRVSHSFSQDAMTATVTVDLTADSPKRASKSTSDAPVASSSKTDVPVDLGPDAASNWEFAVRQSRPLTLTQQAVWAFIWRFAPYDKYPYMPATIEEFEECLEAKFDPSFDDVDTVSLGYVLKWIARISGGVWFGGGKNYTHFLQHWVDGALDETGQRLCDLYERWDGENLVRDKRSIYALEWTERVHLLRLICDWALSDCEAVRDKIEAEYNLKPQIKAKRDRVDNYLVVEKIGVNPEAKSHHILHIDDSPRIFELHNSVKKARPWVQLSKTEDELEDVIDRLCGPVAAKDEKKMASIFEGKSGKLKNELRQEYESRVVPVIERRKKRLAKVEAARQRDREKHAKELAKLEEEERLAAEPTPPPVILAPRARAARVRTRPKVQNVDYGISDEEGDAGADDDAYDDVDVEDEDEQPRVNSRSTRAAARNMDLDDFEDYEIGSDDEVRRKPGRASTRATRSRARYAEDDEEDDPIAAVAAYEARGPFPQIPIGARNAAYDLDADSDYEVWKGRKEVTIKGRKTARREVLEQLSSDISKARTHARRQGRRVPDGHDPSDYNVNQDEDSIVYSNGHERSVKGFNAAVEVIAQDLVKEATRLLAEETEDEPKRKLVKKAGSDSAPDDSLLEDDRRRSSSHTSAEPAKDEDDYQPGETQED